MPTRIDTLNALSSGGLVAVIRTDDADSAVQVCRALAAGGVNAWEIAMTTPGALRAIEQVADELGDQGVIGVGTVLDTETAVAAVHAGAQFVFAPTMDPRVIEAVHRYDKVMVPGALTPTEIATAWAAGADLVKVFPANHFGPKYFRDLRGPLPQIRLTPTGGVNLDTVAEWLDAGAFSLGVGSALVKKDWITAGRWDDLSQLAGQFVQAVQTARGN